MSTFQTRFSRDSSKNNILGSLNEFFVSAKPVNHKMAGAAAPGGGGEMRRQRSEMLIDRTSRSLVPPKDTNSNNHLFCGAMQNRLEMPKVVKATPAPFQKQQIASSPSSNKPGKALDLKDSK